MIITINVLNELIVFVQLKLWKIYNKNLCVYDVLIYFFTVKNEEDAINLIH